MKAATALILDTIRYLRIMRILIPFLSVAMLFAGCNSEDGRVCPKTWNLERAQISAYASADSGQLHLEVWNPVTTNAIELSQEYLEGDFEVSVKLLGMESDSVLNPQVRLEVYLLDQADERISGVAVQPDIFYCYVGGPDPSNSDNRLVHTHQGDLRVSRVGELVSSYANFGGIELTKTDTVSDANMGVRIVFGSTNMANGSVRASLTDFRAWQDWPNANIQGPPVNLDYFNCESW